MFCTTIPCKDWNLYTYIIIYMLATFKCSARDSANTRSAWLRTQPVSQYIGLWWSCGTIATDVGETNQLKTINRKWQTGVMIDHGINLKNTPVISLDQRPNQTDDGSRWWRDLETCPEDEKKASSEFSNLPRFHRYCYLDRRTPSRLLTHQQWCSKQLSIFRYHAV